MKPINLGLLGVGTVGGGTAQVIQRNAKEISRRIGRTLCLLQAASLHPEHARTLLGPDIAVTNNAYEVVHNPNIDIIVELIGGDTVAKDLVLHAIDNGKHVVTANKKLLAIHGTEIFARAQKQGVMVAFEAAVAGGIPIIKALREGLSANRIEWIAGIINGTSNFILTQMRERSANFAKVLAKAQQLGYAEADPTFDIEGHDAGHKITIMAALAFGTPLQFDRCYLEGISQLEAQDIQYAEELGYRVKLIGLARRTTIGIELRVHPTLLPAEQLLANVDGVMNAVLVKGDAVGPTLYYGAGAGALPTASAVIADIIDITRLQTANSKHWMPYLGFQSDQLQSLPMLPIEDIMSAYYLRIRATDQTGVMADITRLLADHMISIEAVLQKGPPPNNLAEIIILTHCVIERTINQAIEHIEALSRVSGKVIRLRMETLA